MLRQKNWLAGWLAGGCRWELKSAFLTADDMGSKPHRKKTNGMLVAHRMVTSTGSRSSQRPQTKVFAIRMNPI